MRVAACGGCCRKKRNTGNKTVRHSGPVLASNSRPRIAQRFLPLPVLAPILRERDALRFLPSLAGEGLRMGAIGGRNKDGGDGAGIQTIESFWIAAYATMTEKIALARHSGLRAGIQAIECSESRLARPRYPHPSAAVNSCKFSHCIGRRPLSISSNIFICSALIGVGTPCRAPVRTISPVTYSSSVLRLRTTMSRQ